MECQALVKCGCAYLQMCGYSHLGLGLGSRLILGLRSWYSHQVNIHTSAVRMSEHLHPILPIASSSVGNSHWILQLYVFSLNE